MSVQSTSPKVKSNDDIEKEPKNSNKILLAGLGLSAIAIAGVLITKGRRKTPIKPPSAPNNPSTVNPPVHPQPSTNIPPDSNTIVSEVITDIRKNIPEEELKQIQKNSFYGSIHTKDQSNFEKLQQTIAVEKAQIKAEIDNFPKAIIGIPDNSGKLISLMLNSQHSQLFHQVFL